MLCKKYNIMEHSIKELRNFNSIDIDPRPLSTQVRYLMKQNIDYDVYLPTKGINLQRDRCWNLDQKRELIWSILIQRNIPPISMLNIIDGDGELLQIIDGKQRLTTIMDFVENKFSISLEGGLYTFDKLPEDYKRGILGTHLSVSVFYEEVGKPLTDIQKIEWFKFINFSGTPQDSNHMEKLS